MQTRETDWFNGEHAKLLKDGRSWGNEAMYQAKMECLDWCIGTTGITKGARILDVGCGTAELAGRLRKNGYEAVDGIDTSAVAIEHAALTQTGTFLTMDFTLPTRLGTAYDCIYDTDCLHMVIRPEARRAFLKNVRNNLREQGVFLTGINASREGVDPYVDVDGVIQYFWPRRAAYLAEVVTSDFHLVASRDLPPRNKKRCEMWSEMIFKKDANQTPDGIRRPADESPKPSV
jgi:2-polyprenyl-3-methyl-5-hydroxy-6-metoxy-1,4-benzoquinol methylase